MGTFVDYYGSRKIGPEKIHKFAQAVSKILYYGGMMHLRNVEMYGKKILLLDPVIIRKGEDVDFTYNYFEEDFWENAGYVYGENRFYSGKVGGSEFNMVVTAVLFLYELYDEGRGFVMENDDIVLGSYYVGWINNILGTRYNIKKQFDFWENAELYASEICDYDQPIGMADILYMIPKESMKYAGGTELSDLLYIINGTDSLNESVVSEGTYPYDVFCCKKAIMKLIRELGEVVAYEQVVRLIKESIKERKAEKKELLKSIVQCSVILPARVLLYLLCELEKKPFWKEWEAYKDVVYRDEKMKNYATDDLMKFRKKGRNKPIGSVRTSDFLRNEDPFIFWDTPDELKDKPNYYISDADRLYWWDSSDEVVIEKDTDTWLNKIAEDYKNELSKQEDVVNTQELVKEMIELLYDIEERYARVYAFQEMFYEFIINGGKKEYRAAISVLRQQYEKNAKSGKVIKKMKSWKFPNKNVLGNEGRMNMKRYLSLLANKALRKKYMGF